MNLKKPMGIGSSQAINNFIQDVKREEIERIHESALKFNKTYKEFDEYNTLEDLCIEMKLLEVIIQKYDIYRIEKEKYEEQLGTSDINILRMIINEQNEKYELNLPKRKLGILCKRYQNMLRSSIEDLNHEDMKYSDYMNYYKKKYEEAIYTETIKDLMYGLNPIYIQETTKRIIRDKWNVLYMMSKEQRESKTLERKPLTIYDISIQLGKLCKESGIIGDSKIINKCIDSLEKKVIEYNTFDGRKIKDTMIIIPYEVPEWLWEKVEYEDICEYDTTYEKQWLTLLIRNEDIINVTTGGICLETRWYKQYYYVKKPSNKKLLGEWKQRLKGNEQQDDLIKISICETQKKQINEIIKGDIKDIKSKVPVIFINDQIDNSENSNKKIHIINDKWYKKLEFINLKNSNGIGELNYIIEGKIIGCKDPINKKMIIIKDIQKIQWKIENYKEEEDTVIKYYNKIIIEIETKENKGIFTILFMYDEITQSWEIKEISKGLIELYIEGSPLNEYEYKNSIKN